MSLAVTFLDKVKYVSQDFRARFADFFGNGVVNLSHFPISYSSPANMTVTVGSTSVTSVAWCNGGYRVTDNATTTNLTFAAADPTNPRIDIIQLGVNASVDANGETTGSGVLQIKQGVAAASPIEPGADPGFVKLWAVNIPAGSTSISSSNVTDRRTLVPLNVSGTQITMLGAAGTGQANTFAAGFTQTFNGPVVMNGTVTTAHNTLDDGSGKATFANTVTVPSNSVVKGTATGANSYSDLIFQDSAGTGYGYVGKADNTTQDIWLGSYNGGIQLSPKSGSYVKTPNNTLDDGNGKATFAGGLSSKKNTMDDGTGISYWTNSMYLVPGGTATSTTNYDSQILSFQRSTWNGSAAVVGTNYFKVFASGDLNYINESVQSLFAISQSGKITSKNNTLDDGSGKVILNGGTLTLSNATSNLVSFNTVGTGAPNATASNTGTKIQLWNDGTSAYGLGIDTATTWYSTNQYHKWYTQNGTANTTPTVVATLDGAGNYSVTGAITTGHGIDKQTMPDTRSTATNAADYYQVVKWNMKTSSTISITDGSGYVALQGFNPWTDDSAGGAHEMAYTDQGHIYHRMGKTSSGWGTWSKIIQDDGTGTVVLDKGSTNSYALKLTSSGAGWGSGMYFENTTAGTGKTYGIYSGSGGNFIFGIPSSGTPSLVINGLSVGTANNTLDDGTGKATFTGIITTNSGLMYGGGTGDFGILPTTAGKNIGFIDQANNGWLIRANDGTKAVYTWNNTLDDGSGNITAKGAVILGGNDNASGAYTTIYIVPPATSALGMDAYGNLTPINPAGMGTGATWNVSDKNNNSVIRAWIDGTKKVSTANNTLDDGSGNMSVGNGSTANYIVANSATANLHIRPKVSGNVGFANNAGTAWGLYTTDSATPAAYTFKNTLDDGTGKSYWNQDMYLDAGGTATSTTDYWSRSVHFGASHWNGSAAVSYDAYLQSDNLGGFRFYSNGSGANKQVLIVDQNGNSSFAGAVSVAAATSSGQAVNLGQFTSGTGWTKLPNGMILQYFTVTISGATFTAGQNYTVTINYPVAFTSTPAGPTIVAQTLPLGMEQTYTNFTIDTHNTVGCNLWIWTGWSGSAASFTVTVFVMGT